MSEDPRLTADLDTLLARACERLRPVLAFDYAGLALPDATRKAYTLHVIEPARQTCPVINGPAPLAGRTRQAQFAGDLPPSEVPLPQADLLQSQLAAPLVAEDQVLGVLVLGRSGPEAFTAAQLPLLAALADQIALSVAATTTPQPGIRATIEMQLQQASTLQRIAVITSATLDIDEMLVATVHETAALLNVEGALLTTLSANARQLEVHAPSVWGFGTGGKYPIWPVDGFGHIIHAYHTGQSFLSNTAIDDPLLETLHPAGKPVQSALTVPLNTRNRTLGTLSFLNKAAGMSFDETDLELVRTISGQIAVSLESAQLFAAERSRADRLALVNTISQELNSVLDQAALLERTVHNIHTLLGYESASLLLVDETGQAARLMAQATSNPILAVDPGFTIPLSQGVVGQAIRTQETQYIADIRESAEFYAPDESMRQVAASSLTIPLRSGETVLGALDLISTTANAFTESDRIIMQALAAHVTTALENARLFRQARRQVSDQRFLRKATVGFSRAIMLPDLLALVADSAQRALSPDCVSVALRLNNGQFVQHVTPDPPACLFFLTAALHTDVDRYPAVVEALHRQQTLLLQPGMAAPDMTASPPLDADLAALADDLQATHLLVPIVQRQTYIGLIEAVFTSPDSTPQTHALALIESLAQQAAIAAENVNLIEELEQRARELGDANRLKNEFLARISHELRTPMNSIIGFSETLRSGIYGELSPQAGDRVERILRNGRILLTLIDDLLDISRIEAGKMSLRLRAVSLIDIVQAAVEASESQFITRGLHLSLHIPPELPPVHADAVRLRQVINNLLSNALKFTHEGTITIRMGSETGQEVWCSITDTGIGIEAADQAIIFDEFRQVDGTATREYSGTGLGLAITR
ncbi:MAG: GAF domain-containing protein, partial [Anaerolineae bacterium]|nr:GAF domain-containing protein [Anaerolineae bacterium]